MAKKPRKPVQAATSDGASDHSTTDLDQIRREMSARQPGPNKRLVRLAAVGGTILLAVALLCVWSFYRYNLGRQSFRAIYQNADLENMRIFAPGDYKEIEELRKKAQAQNWLFHPGAVASLYGEAGRKVSAATAKVDNVKRNYEVLRKQFGKLKEEAKAQNLAQYAQSAWQRIEQIDRNTADPTAADFDPDAAIRDLHTAIQILEQQRNNFGVIKQYEAARQAYIKMAKDLNPEEWKKVAPRIEATLRSSLGRAKAAAAAAQWKRAAMAYRDALSILEKGSSEIMSARKAARQAQTRLEAALAKADRRELAASAARAWAAIQKKQADFKAALKAYRYREAAKAAEDTVALLQKVQADIKEAKTRRTEVLKKLEDRYTMLAKQEELLLRNWKPEWTAAKDRYRQVQKLARGRDYVALLEAARNLLNELDALAQKLGGISGELGKAKTAFEKLYKKAVPELLIVNAPDLWDKVANRRAEALGAEKRANMREAVNAYNDAAAALGQALDTVDKLIATGKKLRAEIRRRQHEYRRGLNAFATRKRTLARRLIRTAGRAWEKRNYRSAVEMLRKVASLLPANRFEARTDGTVVDYGRGLLWVADGAGKGCMNGEKLDWYSARTRVNQLIFAGKRLWRLPTDDELQSLLDVDPKEFAKLFPNTRPDYYWTKTQMTDDTEHALCIHFGTRKTRLCRKNDRSFVRPVFAP
ncbi:MAG: DUF1566 domain-containing protein [Kiritimatiellaeota bacterium]|nr:DUF1566 domain-containing protein [Kiritimatiellota bacterium]